MESVMDFAKKINLKSDKEVYISVSSGHFATNHSHINSYVDLTRMKTSQSMAKRAAAKLAGAYQTTLVNTILCLEGTSMIGAFLAEELSSHARLMGINRGFDINVIKPELNSNKQMIFQDNLKSMVLNQNVIMLLSSVSTGKTIVRAVDCLNYYGGILVGICAGFSAKREYEGIPINAVFTDADLPEYRSYIPHECEICTVNKKIDAIVNENGFSLI